MNREETGRAGSGERGDRPWGYYLVLHEEAGCKVKMILVRPEKRLSLQRHRHRAEHWYLVRGDAVVTLEEEAVRIRQGQALDIPAGARHRIQNVGQEDVVFIEVQTGAYLGEDDIERFDDDFGRV